MANMGEREMPFDLLGALLEYIASLQIPGAVLVFLPGWAQIFACLKHLQQAVFPIHTRIQKNVMIGSRSKSSWIRIWNRILLWQNSKI